MSNVRVPRRGTSKAAAGVSMFSLHVGRQCPDFKGTEFSGATFSCSMVTVTDKVPEAP